MIVALNLSAGMTLLLRSVAYLAPEMLLRQGHGKAVDWYLLGVLLYEMLVGVPPHFGQNTTDIFANISAGSVKVPVKISE